MRTSTPKRAGPTTSGKVPDNVIRDIIDSKTEKVLTDCGHVSFPPAIMILGEMTTDCEVCGRRARIIRHASARERNNAVLGLALDYQPLFPDEPPF